MLAHDLARHPLELGADPAVRALLRPAHQRAVADDVRIQDRGQPALHALLRAGSRTGLRLGRVWDHAASGLGGWHGWDAPCHARCKRHARRSRPARFSPSDHKSSRSAGAMHDPRAIRPTAMTLPCASPVRCDVRHSLRARGAAPGWTSGVTCAGKDPGRVARLEAPSACRADCAPGCVQPCLVPVRRRAQRRRVVQHEGGAGAAQRPGVGQGRQPAPAPVPQAAAPASRGAARSRVRPLAPRLDPEVAAHLAERDLHLPALDEPAQDLHEAARLIGAKEACGSSWPKGSRTSTHRVGAAGIPPWRGTPVAPLIPTMRPPPLHQPGTAASLGGNAPA